VENNLPATPQTPYRIASLTKTFASTLLMQLVEQGKLHLDDPMSNYAPHYKDDRVKVRHVLSHTSEGTPGTRYA
jgi:CubicO group peptidase (beta-lactamase class C family)